MRKLSLHILLLASTVLCSYGQKVDLKYHTTNEGLSNNRIWDINQDAQGFIWASTDGLNRFDGQRYLNYTNHLNPIFDPLDKTSLFQIIGDNLYLIRNKELVGFNLTNGINQEFPLNDFLDEHAIIGAQLFKASKQGLIIPIFHPRKNEVSLVFFRDNSFQQTIRISNAAIDFNSFQFILASSESGSLFYFHKNISKLIKINEEGETIQEVPLLSKGVKAITYAPNGDLLLNYRDNINAILKNGESTFQLHSLTNNDKINSSVLYDILTLENGDIWISGEDRNLLFYENKTEKLFDFQKEVKKIIPNKVTLQKLFQDETGTIWASTLMGFLQINLQRNWFDTFFTNTIETCGGSCSFRGFTEDGLGNIYASFYSNIFKINSKGEASTLPILPNAHDPFDILFKNENLLLNNGHIFDLSKKEELNPYQVNHDSYDIGVFTEDEKGNLWWAHRSKFYFLNQDLSSKKWELKFDGTDEGKKIINDIIYDKSIEKIWIACDNLSSYDPSTNKIESYPELSIGNTEIRFLHSDPNGLVWIGTDNGFFRFDNQTGETKAFTINDGLSNNAVFTILSEGDSCLWLGTQTGLSRFNKRTETFINFYKEDGIAHNEFNRSSAYLAKNGKMYFGGTQGVTAFFPKDVMQKYQNSLKAGKLSLVSFSKSDVKNDTTIISSFHPRNHTVNIYHENRSFQFEFALTNYQNIDKIKYSYQLEGYDEVWSKPSSTNLVPFNNSLPAGQYTFRVKALNSRGQWHPNHLAVQVIIHPPWWMTKMAYSLYFLLLILIGASIFYFLKKRLELQNHLQIEKQEAIRLKELDTFKSRLFTNLTHEFRTPLTVILGMTKQLIEKNPSMEVIKTSEIIERNGENLLRLVNQLLDLSKLEDRSFKLNLQNSNIIPFLRYVTESFQSFANGKNLRLSFFSTIKTLNMDYDPEQVTQVITNLISNALKFTKSGGEINVELVRENDFLIISVSDTGIGIPKENLDNIFDRFYQVDDSTTRANEGTGIGLAHSVELVKLMEGQISVDSDLGKGSTFKVQLKIHQNAKPKEFSEILSDQHDFIKPINLSSLNDQPDNVTSTPVNNGEQLPQILIIEDNVDVIHYLKTCLENLYQISIALNGKIGIEKALESIPDIIISDVMMPEKDGYEVCNTLKNDERTSHIPIILITAKADVASKIEGLSRGADAYLPKPFDRKELLVRLAKMVEKNKKLIAYFSKSSLPKNERKEMNEVIEIEDVFVQKIKKIIEENYTKEDFGLPQLCQKIGMSRSQLFRKMKALTAKAPSEYIRSFRLQKAKTLLETNDFNVSEVAYEVGFKDPSYFSKLFQKEFGELPRATRK